MHKAWLQMCWEFRDGRVGNFPSPAILQLQCMFFCGKVWILSHRKRKRTRLHTTKSWNNILNSAGLFDRTLITISWEWTSLGCRKRLSLAFRPLETIYFRFWMLPVVTYSCNLMWSFETSSISTKHRSWQQIYTSENGSVIEISWVYWDSTCLPWQINTFSIGWYIHPLPRPSSSPHDGSGKAMAAFPTTGGQLFDRKLSLQNSLTLTSPINILSNCISS